jgi:hypothetical protein
MEVDDIISYHDLVTEQKPARQKRINYGGDNAERRRIFRELVPYFGTVQPAAFFRDTSSVVKGVHRIDPLIDGIYKPAGSIYPLSIASMLKSRYRDQLFHNPDRTWWMPINVDSAA